MFCHPQCVSNGDGTKGTQLTLISCRCFVIHNVSTLVIAQKVQPHMRQKPVSDKPYMDAINVTSDYPREGLSPAGTAEDIVLLTHTLDME